MRLILITFGFLGWAWFELSGGSDFKSGREKAELQAQSETVVEVARADTSALDLSSVSAPAFDLTPATLEPVKAEVVTQPVPQPVVAASEASVSLTEEPVVTEPVVVAVVVPEPEPEIRFVTGNRVNMRSGPGTQYSVVSRLSDGAEVVVLQEPGNGWIKLKVLPNGRVGWMADWLITASVFE